MWNLKRTCLRRALLNPKLDNLRISRYLVIMVTSCVIDLHNNGA